MKPSGASHRIGLISDTHGLLRAEAIDALAGADSIIHAGDIGNPQVLRALESIAPTVAVRGNNDRGPWAEALSAAATFDISGVRMHVLHDIKQLALDPVAERIGVVVSGHSHRPSIVTDNGVVFINPGSAGPRRFSLPVAVAILEVAGGVVSARILELPVPMPSRARSHPPGG